MLGEYKSDVVSITEPGAGALIREQVQEAAKPPDEVRMRVVAK